MGESNLDFEQFREQKLAEGFDEVLERPWQPNFANDPHTHPFDTSAYVVEGEFWLEQDGTVQHLQAGDRFELRRNIRHSERYGPKGALFWAARKN